MVKRTRERVSEGEIGRAFAFEIQHL
jgi:hypothetical protein